MNSVLPTLAFSIALVPTLLTAEPASTPRPASEPTAQMPAIPSAAYRTGMAAIGQAARVCRDYTMLLSSVDNKVEMYWKKSRITRLYRELDACTWKLSCLRCPENEAEAARLTEALQQIFHVAEADEDNLRKIQESHGYGLLGWLVLTEFNRPIGKTA